MFFIRRVLLFVSLILILGLLPAATAQSYLEELDTRPQRGLMPNYDQISSPVDNIEVISGKLNLTIPLASMPRGQGGTGFDLNLQYDSHIYDLFRIYDLFPLPPTYQEWDVLTTNLLHNVTLTGGWTYNINNYMLDIETETQFPTGPSCYYPGHPLGPSFDQANDIRTRIILPDGSQHILFLDDYIYF